MNDITLYEQLLSVKRPWRVREVKLDLAGGKIHVHIECLPEVWGCPTCGQRAHIHGHEERIWRHLDTCQCVTLIHARVPRVQCGEHGTCTVRVPWAEAGSRLTALFEHHVILLLRNTTTAAVTRLTGLTWDEADGVKQRAVARGLLRRELGAMGDLCIDEKAVGAGHDYVTVISRKERGGGTTLLCVLDGRERATLDAFWQSLTPGQLASITSVSMDFWDPFIRSTLQHVPDAREKIVHDLFHLVQKANRAVDEVRRQEHAELKARGDDRLRKTRFAWLYAVENRPEQAGARAQAAIEANLRTARAWGYKEALREIFKIATSTSAGDMLRHWVACVRRTRMEPLRKFASSLKAHLHCVINYFRHGRTNAESESMNSRLQALITKSCGYRNRERFKNDAYFHFGNLDLFPWAAG